MLNFRNTNIFFISLFVVMIAVQVLYRLPVYWFLLAGGVYSLLLFWGSYFVGSNFYFPVICSLKTEERLIALSFDDGPVNQYTPQLLEILRESNTPAAFFCIGKRVEENQQLFRQVYEEGHLIGNHSYSHDTWFDLFSPEKMKADLRAMDEVMEKIIGRKPRLFRPPYGVTNPNLKKAVMHGNYVPVGWNIRSLDTVITDEKKLLAKVTKALKPGAVVLFHDTAKAIPVVLPAFIRYARENGYKIIRLDKLLNLEAYA